MVFSSLFQNNFGFGIKKKQYSITQCGTIKKKSSTFLYEVIGGSSKSRRKANSYIMHWNFAFKENIKEKFLYSQTNQCLTIQSL